MIAIGVLVGVARYNFLGLAPRGRRSAALAVVDLALRAADRRDRADHELPPGRDHGQRPLGRVPKWSDLLFGMTVAVIAYTGIEAAANLAPEVRVKRRGAAQDRRRAARSPSLIVFVGHVGRGPDGAAGPAGIPVAGEQRAATGPSWAAGTSRARCSGSSRRSPPASRVTCSSYAVAIVATLVLSQAANAGMVGIARTAYTLATHRQIPRGGRAPAPALRDALDRARDLHGARGPAAAAAGHRAARRACSPTGR